MTIRASSIASGHLAQCVYGIYLKRISASLMSLLSIASVFIALVTVASTDIGNLSLGWSLSEGQLNDCYPVCA